MFDASRGLCVFSAPYIVASAQSAPSVFVASLSAALSAAALPLVELLVGGVLVGALASGSANSCLNTAYSLTVQQSMSYKPGYGCIS